ARAKAVQARGRDSRGGPAPRRRRMDRRRLAAHNTSRERARVEARPRARRTLDRLSGEDGDARLEPAGAPSRRKNRAAHATDVRRHDQPAETVRGTVSLGTLAARLHRASSPPLARISPQWALAVRSY